MHFLVETLKAWNKLHDPMSDGMLESIRYCLDFPGDNAAHEILVGAAQFPHVIYKSIIQKNDYPVA